MQRGNQRFYVATDQVGSPRVVTDAAGVVVKRLRYDAFGGILEDSAPGFDLPIGFAGGLPDPTTGLVRFGVRDYDPLAGRFTTPDPLLFGGSPTNLYAYAGSDPVNFRDPSGMICFAVSGYWVIGAGVEVCWTPDDGTSVCGEGGIGTPSVGFGVNLDGDTAEDSATLNVEGGLKLFEGLDISGNAELDLVALANKGCVTGKFGGNVKIGLPLKGASVQWGIDSEGRQNVTPGWELSDLWEKPLSGKVAVKGCKRF
jgi:RHS repeat-associated protein